MVILPEDICNYILSFLPVRDSQYDQCMDQLKFLYIDHEGWRHRILNSAFTYTKIYENNFISLQKYILMKNRIKFHERRPKKYSLVMEKKMKEHRQKLRLQLIQQQVNTVVGDQWTMK